MDTNKKAQKILKEINFDFGIFTMDKFLSAIGEKKGREIITLPWEMPPTMFGAWISDDDEPREYIFYRNNVPDAHQIHIQLHELAHFLFGHPTLKINRKMIEEAASGATLLPFADLPQRSPKIADAIEIEAETLAGLIQQQAIRYFKIEMLVHNTNPEQKLGNFLRKMGA